MSTSLMMEESLVPLGFDLDRERDLDLFERDFSLLSFEDNLFYDLDFFRRSPLYSVLKVNPV